MSSQIWGTIKRNNTLVFVSLQVSAHTQIGYPNGMTWEELTPEAVAILKVLLRGPHPLEDTPLLQLMLADRLVKGSPEKIHITHLGSRLLAQYVAAEIS